ncbi:MAG: DNA recombination protein RmuC [Bacteriovoracaceae bacterium]|nr:DNA recombination protein RmuC [Bacteriovoracaceae bacterium]
MTYLIVGIVIGFLIGALITKLLTLSSISTRDKTIVELETRLDTLKGSEELTLESEQRLEKGLTLATKSNFSEIVGNLFAESSKRQGEIVKLLENTGQSTHNLLKETRDLQSMLYNNQARGAFGEQIIASMIDRLGLIEGVHYETQFTNQEGNRPDFIFYMPEEKYLVMDSKFPFASYAKIFEGTESDREVKAFLSDVKKHYKAIGKKDYKGEAGSLDFVCMLIPNDEIFSFIQRADSSLFVDAMDNNVLICSPALLYPILNIVRHCVKVFGLSKNSHEILDLLEQFEKEWDKHAEEVSKLETSLQTASSTLDRLVGVRGRAVERLFAKKNKLIEG